MQVVVGTLDSFAKSSGAASASPAYRGGAPDSNSGIDAARVAGLEAQVRALTTQVQQLTEQVRSGQSGAQRRSDAPASQPSVAGSSSGFGSTTVQAAPDTSDGVLAASTSSPPPSWSGQQQATAPVTAASPPSDGGENPKQLYEVAYGYLLSTRLRCCRSGI